MRFTAFAALLAGTALIAYGALAAESDPRVAALKPSNAPYIDAHVHMDENDADQSIKLLLASMMQLNGARAFIQTEPYGPVNPARWDIEKVLPAIKANPGKVIITGGGGTLNPMILDAYAKNDAGAEAQKKFRARAEEILKEGAAGFGELSIEHFSTPAAPVKDYEYAPADSPLMLELADIAAEHNVPVVLHMEAVEVDKPSKLPPPNPPMLHANFAAFERFLSHNPRAKVIWAHLGSDNTGDRTPEKMRPLFDRHPNLYMEIKYDPGAPAKNPPVVDGKLKPEWRQLFIDYSDRLVIGSDQHYDPPSKAPLARAQANALLLNQLPPDVAKKIGVDNPLKIYGQKP